MNTCLRLIAVVTLAVLLNQSAFAQADDAEQVSETNKVILTSDSKFEAIDSLDVGIEAIADAKLCLDGLKWLPGKFPVQLQAARKDCGDWLVRFPSSRPSGNAMNDEVAMTWYHRGMRNYLPTPPTWIQIIMWRCKPTTIRV